VVVVSERRVLVTRRAAAQLNRTADWKAERVPELPNSASVKGDGRMSDFGSGVCVYRNDSRPPSDVDERIVHAAAKALQFARSDSIGPYDEFELRFGTARDCDGANGLLVALSGYLVGDDVGNDGLEPEVIIAREAPLAEQFAEDLEQALGGEYRVTSYSDYH
jgi:hypothetical protein